MLAEICAETRNYFLIPNGIHKGKYTVSNGKLAPLNFLQEGQYFRIVGSVANDGVYRYPATGLTDESFTGAVWAMAIPPAFVALAEEIKAWTQSSEAKPSALQSESFGGYTYTKATGKSGNPVSWQDVFATRLHPYRRMRIL